MISCWDEGHENRYLNDETFLCRLQSSFNTSDHSRPKQLGPWENVLGGKSSHSCHLSPMCVCFINLVYDPRTLYVGADLHYITLPTFLSRTAIMLILIWLLLCLICFCLGYQHTNIFRYCILSNTFASSVCLNFTLMGYGYVFAIQEQPLDVTMSVMSLHPGLEMMPFGHGKKSKYDCTVS